MTTRAIWLLLTGRLVSAMYDIGYTIGALASSGMVLYGLLRLRQTGWKERGRQALCGAFFFSAVGQLVEVSGVAASLNGLSGVPNLNRLVAYVCATLIGVCEAALAWYWVRGEGVQIRLVRRLVFYGVCILGLVVTFALGDQTTTAQHFTTEHARAPFVAPFLFIYASVQISYLGDVARVGWQLSRIAQQTWTRRGLRLVAIGGAIGVLDAITIAAFVTVTLAGATPKGEEAVSALLVMVASLFLLSGFAVPSLEPQLTASRDWIISYRHHRALYPLWRAFYEAIPGIALDPPGNRWRAVWSPCDLKFRTLRRVIEIRDGRLSISFYIAPEVAHTARRMGADAGLGGQDLEATIEAAQIKAGLRALTRNEPPYSAAEILATPGFREIAGELRWLSRVARAFTGPVCVAAAAAERACRRQSAPETTQGPP